MNIEHLSDQNNININAIKNTLTDFLSCHYQIIYMHYRHMVMEQDLVNIVVKFI